MTEDIGGGLVEVAPLRESKPLEPISKDFRTGITVGLLAASLAGIGYLIYDGATENDLHKSALTGFFWTIWLVAGAAYVAAKIPDGFTFGRH